MKFDKYVEYYNYKWNPPYDHPVYDYFFFYPNKS